MKMKKFINDPANLASELLEGYALAHPDLIEVKPDGLVVNRKLEKADRVAVVSLGGAGHEPALMGYVGEGMLDICVVGDIFAAPGPQAVVEAIRLADRGKGVLLVVFNHAGDMLTAGMAMKRAEKLGLHVKKVVAQEDIANTPRERGEDRRGLVGGILLHKIAGAAAAQGKRLDEVAAIAQRFADNMATLAVATRGATHPSSGEPLAQLEEDEMEIGMGQHGEGGGGRQQMKTADETAELMLDALVQDLSLKRGEKVLLVLNGAGATTLMELLLVYRRCVSFLKEKGIDIVANFVGEMLTVQEQAGFQMCVVRMDEEALGLWNQPCNTPYFKKV